MSETKNAVVVGKVELKPRKEVIITKNQDRRPPPPKREEGARRPRGMKRAGDDRQVVAATQAMLQELNFVKKQLREAQEQRDSTSTKLAIFAADVRRLVEELAADPVTRTFTSEALSAVNKALGI